MPGFLHHTEVDILQVWFDQLKPGTRVRLTVDPGNDVAHEKAGGEYPVLLFAGGQFKSMFVNKHHENGD